MTAKEDRGALDIEGLSTELLSMIDRLGAIRAVLNTESAQCGKCGTKHYLSWEEHKLDQALEGAVGALDRGVGWLGKKLDKGDDDAKRA